jgi:hypothetical protein
MLDELHLPDRGIAVRQSGCSSARNERPDNENSRIRTETVTSAGVTTSRDRRIARDVEREGAIRVAR